MKELAVNCDFENREEVIIRDIFITNILDDEIQRQHFCDTIDPEKVLSIAVILEMGHQNEHEYLPTTSTLILMESMLLYYHSVDFAAHMLVQIRQAKRHLIE